jgi:hypothetical protein
MMQPMIFGPIGPLFQIVMRSRPDVEFLGSVQESNSCKNDAYSISETGRLVSLCRLLVCRRQADSQRSLLPLRPFL